MTKKSIIHISASSDFGGGPQFIYNLSKYSNHNHYYYGPDGSYLNEISKYNKVISTNFNRFFNSYLIKRIFDLKIKNIHLHGRGALIFNFINILIIKILYKSHNINIIYTPHGLNVKFSFIDYVSNFICFNFINTITFVSKDEYYLYSKLYNLKNNYRIIKNGVPINTKLQKKFKIKNKNLISFSRFNEQKNTILLCRIASMVPEFNFYIFGNGKKKNECIEFCNSNKIKNVIFKNFTKNKNKALLTGFCYISTSIWEGLPLSVLEALSLNRSICISDVIGHREFLDLKRKNIKYFKINDIKSVGHHIKYLYNTFSNQNFKKNIDQFKLNYDIKVTTKKYNLIYL